MNDIKISKKEDLYFYTEDDSERKKRLRALLFRCEKYKPISKDYYTYNDYTV